MAKNEFLTFGIAEGANVLSNEEYAALAARVNGFSAGVAKSRELNKARRQSSIKLFYINILIIRLFAAGICWNGYPNWWSS
ncbi:hypothetical protein [Photorhabdus heterorhabditis]|uniref:hypothetical protein n=1 Tax=Photorhabdus heterorhabditis TaxID=880156 RepID=UPI0015628F6A|nr:hypothetical protein [Photorhabdus heterorhabditis]NRN28691.1 hypothetical protein [Photorhabdus heterorhabditis subsp. aluminescens]